MASKPGYHLPVGGVKRASLCIETLLDLLSQQIGNFNLIKSFASPVVLNQGFLSNILGSPGTLSAPTLQVDLRCIKILSLT